MKRKFTKDEDSKICQLVNQYGAKNWDQIAQKIPGRTGRQCRDRYRNYLVPGFFNGQWTQEEDELLYEKFNQMGRQWSKMKKFFPGRSANSLRNRWNYFVCRLKDERSEINNPILSSFKDSRKENQKNQNVNQYVTIREIDKDQNEKITKSISFFQIFQQQSITIKPETEEKIIYGVNVSTQTNESIFSSLNY